MMIAVVRKNLSLFILKPTSAPVCRSPVSFSFHPHFFSTSREISPTIFDVLVRKYDFPPEFASKVASELTRHKNPENAYSILSFLNESGFSNAQLQKIVKYKPRTLAASLEDSIKPKIKVFQDLGFPSKDICKMISRNPTILALSLNNNIVPSLSMIKGLLESNSEVGRVIRNSPRLLSVNFENTVVPNVEFFKSCGVPMRRIRSVFSNFPNSFLIKPEHVRKSAEKAKEMGIDASSKGYIYAISTIAARTNETLELKLQALRDLGFSDSHISTMVSNAPLVLSVSVEKMKKVKEILLATGKFDLSSIVSYPMSFINSVEKRYVPRLQILGLLESRNLIEEWPRLAKICTLTDVKFFEKFISPYLNEISDVYISGSFSGGKEKNDVPVIR